MKNSKFIIIAVLIVLLIIAIYMGHLKTNYKVYKIEDKCGRLVKVFGHTVETESACKSQCRAKCESQDVTLKKIEFTANENGCNFCACYCK